MRSRIAGCILAGLLSVMPAYGQETPRVLFFSKSSGFEHPVISYKKAQPSHAEHVLQKLADENGVELTATKDGSLINAENLANFNLVIFYTTGNLFEGGTDGQPPLPADGLDALIAWVENGGGFMGFHSAADTFGKHDPEQEGKFIKLLGGEFGGHGAQFEGKLVVVDADHSVAANIPEGHADHDEWYTFINLNEGEMHVVALMDPGAERGKQEMYDRPNYPVIWTMGKGAGRVYYNAMGHREDVWDDATFQQMVVDAAGWALGEGELDSEPNFKEVVPEQPKE
ncbi:MAG: ThuA domain-containing protein [Candidatus Hydrogenedentales bacterium]